jgi:hypothetical protein
MRLNVQLWVCRSLGSDLFLFEKAERVVFNGVSYECNGMPGKANVVDKITVFRIQQ